jgi:hypothetical protein
LILFFWKIYKNLENLIIYFNRKIKIKVAKIMNNIIHEVDIVEQVRYLDENQIVYVVINSLLVTNYPIKVIVSDIQKLYVLTHNHSHNELEQILFKLNNNFKEGLSEFDNTDYNKMIKYSGNFLLLYILQSVVYNLPIQITSYKNLSDENKFKVDNILLANELTNIMNN